MKGSEFYGKSPLTRPKWLKALGAVATGGLSLIGSNDFLSTINSIDP